MIVESIYLDKITLEPDFVEFVASYMPDNCDKIEVVDSGLEYKIIYYQGRIVAREKSYRKHDSNEDSSL